MVYLKHIKLFEGYSLSVTLPTINISELYHIGSMDITLKSSHSYEGSGLSVSIHPTEWQKIYKMSSDEIYKLSKDNGVFLDYLKLSDNDITQIIEWGINDKLVEKTNIYRFWYIDEDQDMYTDFDDEDRANAEIEDDEDERVETIPDKLKATPKLEKLTLQKTGRAHV